VWYTFSLLLAIRAICQGNIMLKNFTFPTPPVIGKMEKSKFTFFLTGDRFWENPKSDSDWEFFTQDCPEVHLWLTENKFILSDPLNSYIKDEQCSGIFTFKLEKPFTTLVKVQLVNSAQVKNLIQKEIKLLYPDGVDDKYFTANDWKNAYAVYNIGFEVGYKKKCCDILNNTQT